MKNFQEPEMKLVTFCAEDIIATSITGGNSSEGSEGTGGAGT